MRSSDENDEILADAMDNVIAEMGSLGEGGMLLWFEARGISREDLAALTYLVAEKMDTPQVAFLFGFTAGWQFHAEVVSNEVDEDER